MTAVTANDMMDVIDDYILWFQSRSGWQLFDFDGQVIGQYGHVKPDQTVVLAHINAYEATR